ncbi:MAG: citrate/2-methylcitrate synthase [Pseudomonadales bacterium]
MQTEEIRKGLEGVVVDTTRVSLVDGANGALSYRGYEIGSLLKRPFAEVAALVVTGALDPGFGARLTAASQLSEREQALVLTLPEHIHPMHVLQGLTPLLDDGDGFAEFGEAAQGLVIAAKLPAIVATRFRAAPVGAIRHDDPIRQFLLQIDAPDSSAAGRAFEAAQILQMEHGFNAGTFTARVVASTLAPVPNALSAAFGALHGVLHGGADQAALETADEVGSPERAAAFVDECLASGRRVMGMGHREYRVVDPRARHLKVLAEELTTGTEHERTFRTLEAIERRFSERMAEQGRSLYANVEFYKGLVFRSLGLPPRYFTALFAMARVFGYVAHFMECREDNRLVRPQAHYVGPAVRALEA